MEDLIIILVLLTVGFVVGGMIEKAHLRKVKERERTFLNLPAVTAQKFLEDNSEISYATLVYGSVVISSDFFKDFVAGLKTLFGGRLTTYESLLDRARREAVLRMKEKAMDADIIINTRVETSEIGSDKGISVEVIAYGTAIRYK